MVSPCFCCIHSQRETIDRFCSSRNPITLDSGERIKTAKELIEWLVRIAPEEGLPGEASISKHKRYHIYTDNIKALVNKDGLLMTPDGKAIPHVSADDFLDAVITLAYKRLMDNPEIATISQALEAIERKIKIHGGLQKQGEVEDAWLALLQSRKKKKKEKPIIEGECESIV